MAKTAAQEIARFVRRMQFRAEQVDKNTRKVVRQAALAADSAVVQATPVDTGRARANWVVSVGRPVFQTTPDVDPSGSTAIAQGVSAVRGYRGVGSIFITNSLPYIGFLEEGSSKQAPGGMLKFGEQAATAILRRAKLLSP